MAKIDKNKSRRGEHKWKHRSQGQKPSGQIAPPKIVRRTTLFPEKEMPSMRVRLAEIMDAAHKLVSSIEYQSPVSVSAVRASNSLTLALEAMQCGQCGKTYLDPPCGFSHVLIGGWTPKE